MFPKYSITWDPGSVLDYLASLYPLKSVTLEMLTIKLATLLALSTAQGLQTLSKIKQQYSQPTRPTWNNDHRQYKDFGPK